jgi:sugar phosphate isomerase/epimerase
MKAAVTISLVPEAKGGPFVFWDGLEKGCEQAAALGFDAVEIFPPAASALDSSQLRRMLARCNLQVAAIGTGGGWVLHQLSLTSHEPTVRARARDFIQSIIQVASEFNAPAIIGSMQGRWAAPVTREQALGWLGEALLELGEFAGSRNQVLLYEPLNRYETNLINRLTEAAAFVQNLGTKSVRLLADLFHLNIEEASIAEALRTAGRHVGHVHLADSNRHAMGFGHTDLRPIIEVLRNVGYAGYLSAEVLPLPDSSTAARQTIDTIRNYTT